MLRVSWRADRNRVDALAHFVEHLAEVGVGLGALVALGGAGQPFLVDVANGDHLAPAARAMRVAGTLAADADARHADPLVGARLLCVAQYGRGDHQRRGHGGAGGTGSLQKSAPSGGSIVHGDTPWVVGSQLEMAGSQEGRNGGFEGRDGGLSSSGSRVLSPIAAAAPRGSAKPTGQGLPPWANVLSSAKPSKTPPFHSPE